MINARNSQFYTFQEVDEKKADLMLKCDVGEIREHLMKGTFNSVDLVNFFGSRT